MVNNARYSKDVLDYIALLDSDGHELTIEKGEQSFDLTLPEWYDDKKYKRAQQYFRDNFFTMVNGKTAGLLGILAIPSILNVLIYTKASSVPQTAYRRYVETILHVLTWFEDDLKPGTSAWKSLEAIRKRHVVTNRNIQKHQIGQISQKDLVLTQISLIMYVLLKPHLLGIPVSRANFEAYVHFWRVNGHMIGIEDRFNACTDGWDTTRPRLEYAMNEIFKPALENASADFYRMTTAAIDGLWAYNPMLDAPAVFYVTKYLTGCEGYTYFESNLDALDDDRGKNKRALNELNWYSKFILLFVVTVHSYLINFLIFRWYFNFQLKFFRFVNTNFPILAIVKFGVKTAYVSLPNGCSK